ncbi:MAG: dihydrolipoyl dehydrogenase [Thermoflexales bacterium]|nr:dihydrolipoyl dehydrogenase [Thermoflexales bacterium]
MGNPTYDVTVIGGGPGGYVAAIRAAQLDLKVALVESTFLGGVCLNVGCIPTKALLRNAEIAELLRRGQEFGFSFDNLRLDYSAAHKRSRQVSGRLVKGVQFLMKKNKIDVFEGRGTLKSAKQVAVTPVEAGKAVGGQKFEGVLDTEAVIVATGARPRNLPGLEIDKEKLITYWEALELTEAPKSLVIIGAGAIGLEFAYVFHAYGTQVTLVEMLPHLAPLEDQDLSVELEKAYKKAGITFMLATKVERVEKTPDGVQVMAGEQTIHADKVLVSIGVQPNSDDLGLEALGMATERGYIQIDSAMRTNVPGVYAIGDVTGKLMLAHVASTMGVVAAETIAGRETVELDYRFMPRCIYCHPQIASMGLSEKKAREAGYAVAVGKFPFQANGKALGLGDHSGFVKVIVDTKYGEILGAHMVGAEVTELLPEWVLARSAELSVQDLARSVHAHPSLGEALAEAAHAALGQAIHT